MNDFEVLFYAVSVLVVVLAFATGFFASSEKQMSDIAKDAHIALSSRNKELEDALHTIKDLKKQLEEPQETVQIELEGVNPELFKSIILEALSNGKKLK